MGVIRKMRTILQVVMLGITTAIPSSSAQFWGLANDVGFRKILLGEHQLWGHEPGAGVDAGLGLYGVPVHVPGVSTPARNFGFQVEGQLGSLGAGASAGLIVDFWDFPIFLDLAKRSI